MADEDRNQTRVVEREPEVSVEGEPVGEALVSHALVGVDPSETSGAAEALFALCRDASRVDFFQLMRRIEGMHPGLPRLGEALLPRDEALRVGQRPSLAFSPSAVVDLQPTEGAASVLRLNLAFLGMWGPNGVLPTGLTEFVLRAQDHARRKGRREPIADFVDLFHHRVALLLYRVWARSRPVVARDRPASDHFAGYVAALFGGLEEAGVERNDPVGPSQGAAAELLHMAGWLARQGRCPEGLEALVGDWLGVPVQVESFVGEWLDIPEAYAWKLGEEPPSNMRPLGELGSTALLGPQVYERQHKFRLVVGPVDRTLFQALSPRTAGLDHLKRLVRTYVGDELAWDLLLRVRAGDILPTRLDGSTRLGETSYLLERPSRQVVDHLVDPTAN